MVSNILILTGKSATGKDTIATELEKLGYKRIITFTTRPMRPNEVDGDTYHFISVEDFFKKYLNDFFLEVKFYDVVGGIWFYGSSVESYLNADDKTFCILTPSGVQKLKERSIPYTCFYIDVSDETIKCRQKERCDNEQEAERRFLADQIDFKDIQLLADYTISNEYRKPIDTAFTIDLTYRKAKEEVNG